MTNEQLRQLVALNEQATPAPWGAVYDGSSDWSIGPAEDPQDERVGHIHCRVCIGTPPDAALVVAMRNALPDLLAIVIEANRKAEQ